MRVGIGRTTDALRIREGFREIRLGEAKEFFLVNFEPMRRQTEQWRAQQLSSAMAKLIIYRAFIEVDRQAPKHLAGVVHDHYFNPKYEEFQPRTIWSLSNAVTSAFKELEPIPQFKATAKLGAFLETTAPVLNEVAA